MVARILGAVLRGVLVALLIAMPSILLPHYTIRSGEMVALMALLAALLTIAEYSSTFPSFVEFRDAPPINRMRFVSLFLIVLSLSLIAKHMYEPSNMTALFSGLGYLLGNLLDFPYSPVRLVLLVLPQNVPIEIVQTARAAAGVAYMFTLITVLSFQFSIRVLNWPIANGAFNVWVNLPLFDPTTGGDVVHRLHRDGRINVMLGCLLPFAIPAFVKLAADIVDPALLIPPHTMIWTIAAWAFLPASMLMRGMAMLRIADLIEEKRRKAYANSEAMQTA
ncbi:MAG: hypothetical protein GJ676_10565 [Rhodobacteraceae bacterium]|nr:hypothetical protein [Paracoccaceae bacterium]